MRSHEPTANEKEVIAFLSRPESYGVHVTRVETIETHASRVFLAGALAYKVKKHVTFPFLDFSTVALRRAALEREFALNRPHAPEIYREVVALTKRENGILGFDGAGTVVDHVLVMTRFEQSALLSRIADQGPLAPELARDLADMVVRYHRTVPVVREASAVGALHETLERLADELGGLGDTASGQDHRQLCRYLKAAFERATPLMLERAENGAVRRCHGDLHLNNIVLSGGKPLPFDALEFDEKLGVIDVLHDLAFLLMDLDFHRDRRAANLIFNRYVSAAPLGNEISGIALLPVFFAMRALVRGVVSGERARQMAGEGRISQQAVAEHYLQLADGYLTPTRPWLIAIGGLSGAGKSTLAAALAPMLGGAPGALHLRTDVERKRLFGVAETTKLGPDAYTPEASDRVYRHILDKARACLTAGHSVIVDAVAAKPEERQTMARIAAEAGCGFAGLWLDAPFDLLIARVGARQGDASDADAGVVMRQAQYTLGDIAWLHVDAAGSPTDTLQNARIALRTVGLALAD